MSSGIQKFLEQDSNKDLLKFTTAGSVDDGKSTLIGRLLHDSKSIYEDQVESIKNASGKINNDLEIDFALLTDGLKAEREQGITIDVAYRYFSTPKRKFIIADTPGHEQYTRNMATGASTANLAVILIDARNGILEQSKRHAFISSLLNIPHIVVAVNKMDLVDYSEQVYEDIKAEFIDFAAKLNIEDLHFIPMSALKGDNVVDIGDNMPWYHGQPLMEYLENVYIASDRNLIDLRFPVQSVLRPNLDFRGYTGQVASGVIKKGDAIMVLPSMKKSKVKSIVTFDGDLEYAFAKQSVTITTEDELDISRGDMIVHPNNVPKISRHFEAMVVWMDENSLDTNKNYLIKHSTQSCHIRIDQLRFKVDVKSLHRSDAENLNINEIGRVVFTSKRNLFFDPYRKNRNTGAFIIIDPMTNNTVGAGTILDREPEELLPSNITTGKKLKAGNSFSIVSLEDRVNKNNHKPVTIWLTGLVSSGKREVAYQLEKELFDKDCSVVVLDSSKVRCGLSKELDFSATDRAEHLRRVAETSAIMNDNGIISICAFVSPSEDIRQQVKEIVGPERFIEVFVDRSVENCALVDKTGLYENAKNNIVDNLPGVTSQYDSPLNPDLHLKMDDYNCQNLVNKILCFLTENSIIN